MKLAKDPKRKTLSNYKKQLKKLIKSNVPAVKIERLITIVGNLEFEINQTSIEKTINIQLATISHCNKHIKKLNNHKKNILKIMDNESNNIDDYAKLLKIINIKVKDTEKLKTEIKIRNQKISKLRNNILHKKNSEIERVHNISGYNKPIKIVSGGSPSLGKKR